ncbi:MMPL family transporter [Streptomyces sp. NPDC058665]|uniref:MMPL family transporter n=1 Tax=Streptomyces sp. NPDC058665 TaxID=3346586 RepID=UPI00364826B1
MGAENKRRRLLPWAVVGLWVIVIAVAAMFAGKLPGVQRDEAVDYLPASADSTHVEKVRQELPGGETTDLIVVYHRDGGLTAADREVAGEQLARVASGHELTSPPKGIPSEDGTTLMYPIASAAPERPGADKEEARKAFVDEVRAVATTATGGSGAGGGGSGSDGLDIEVGGAGALQIDMESVFESIDGTLMIATVLVVAFLLILTYRSPFLWIVPLLVVGVAAISSRAVVYGLVQGFDITVTSQSAAIMTVLVFGAGTDYALLLVSRYREELRRVPHPYDAMRIALRNCGPAVVASSGTVAAGLLCLLVADLNSSSGMGPIAAIGVVCALVAMLTLLPAVLVLLGRRVFWPLIPVHGSEVKQRRSFFAAMGTSASRRPVAVLGTGLVLLGALAVGILNLPGTLKQDDSFIDRPESVTAMQRLTEAYPEQSAQPISVMAPAGRADAALERARTVPGVADAERGRSGNGWTEIAVFAKDAPESAGETATIERLRSTLDDGIYVGGPSARQLDLADTSASDRLSVIPLVIIAVLLILVALLRSLVAPLMLVVAVVVVWGAAMGIGGLVFEPLLGFGGTDPGLPLLSFVFLVALGVDYGIFLMHRMREEALKGAEPEQAALSALRSTGGVIASAGVVLAATFAVLASLPLVQLAEMGILVAVGVLLDTFLVRTYLVTSASVLLGRKVWWPGALSKPPAAPPSDGERVDREREPVGTGA